MQISTFIKNYERDLQLKNYAKNSIKNYVSQIGSFLSRFIEKDSPKHISVSEIKDYLLTAKEINSQKHMQSAIKLFYKYTVVQPMKFAHIEYPKSPKKLPQVIDKDYLIDKINNIQNLKHKFIIMLAYSTGMRVSEVCSLTITDIDSKRMLITIRQAKGNKDRIVPLSENVLKVLRQYFTEYKPKEYLFNGQFGLQYSHRSCNEIVKKYLGADYHFHLLRHSNATALLESGTDIRIIQKLLGHNSSKTTEVYTHVSKNIISKVNTPI
jgi:site-specific recombinase XerD